MFARTFYNGTIRKYIILFGTLFNNIYINRTASSGKDARLVQTMRVPLSYGPKNKFLARVDQNPDLERAIAIVLPRMSFEIVSMSYAPERKLQTINKMLKSDTADPAVLKYTYNPVPYDIQLQLSIMTKNADDGTKIVEQILPYFTPEWTTTINVIPELDIKLDIPVILNSVSYNDDYASDFIQRRAITWDLNFTLKGYLFGPTRKSALINQANTQIFIPTDATSPASRILVTPGLTAEGEPTNDPSLSVPISEISPNDNYGFITDFSGVFEQ
jgi:hypothetical protein